MAAGRASRRVFFSITLMALAGAGGAVADSVPSVELTAPAEARLLAPPAPAELDARLFPLPEALEDNVNFWTDVFAEYTSEQAVLHDEEHLDIVYAVLDYSRLEASDLSDVEKYRRREKAAGETIQRYSSILLALANDRAPDDEDHRRVRALLEGLPGGSSKFRQAKDRLRIQTGLKDRFAAAIERSGRYMSEMEASFTRHGVPPVLTRMAFVESMFQEGARSKVGAGGVWQLMPSTARHYLNIGAEVDERFDPLAAAEAAARILRSNFQSLESWPLAVTAYNHGANGMRRAVTNLGTNDPGVVLTQHKSRTYGFASRNFYAEFLAAAKVYAHRRVYFPQVQPQPPLRFDTFVPGLYVSVLDLAHQSGLDLDDFKELNPAFDGEIWQGGLLVPKGYRLRVPSGSAERVAAAYDALPDSRKSPYQAGRRHRVRSGDTLSGIARRYGTSVAALQRANKLRGSHLIRIGQTLLIPARGGVYRPPAPAPTRVAQAGSAPKASDGAPPSPPDHEITHVVQAGEVLSAIAERYGTSTATLARLNGLADTHQIRVGQRLRIPASGGA
ncbi:MAG: LysM peptidoglycan-binding domain-containing protein, partial [Acidobacteria bacterium]|nr:LysM peptidoglycan-binding domain-containing protein [Acidobacteriota bacterium]